MHPPSFQPTRLALEALAPSDDNFSIDAVDLLLDAAIKAGASDLHLHPRAKGWDVLFRVDGVLTDVATLTGGGSNDPVTRLMVLANLPTYRSSQPMEGRLRWEAMPTDISMRLGIFPSVHGPRAAVRLLYRRSEFDNLESLDLPADVIKSLLDCCDQTDGAILLSGPSGSGKTTTMYAVLRKIASAIPRRSVMTIEDPVESIIDAISQSELDETGGMSLASALRSAVRQDIEVLLVSEVRDPETAEAAMQAALTGHLIFSSLHATDIPAALRRLSQLGVPIHVIVSAVRAIVCQRLLRRTCTECGGGAKGDVRSCTHCLGTGYRGRIPLAQAIRMDGSDPVGDALAESLEAGHTLDVMREAARRAGGTDLAARAGEYVARGWTTPQEIYRVLGQHAGED